MTTHDNLAVAAGLSVDPARWREQFDDLMGRIAGRFARVEPRRRALGPCQAGTVAARLPLLVKVAGIRWTTEENFQASQGLTGLDEHQVRRWDCWYRPPCSAR